MPTDHISNSPSGEEFSLPTHEEQQDEFARLNALVAKQLKRLSCANALRQVLMSKCLIPSSTTGGSSKRKTPAHVLTRNGSSTASAGALAAPKN